MKLSNREKFMVNMLVYSTVLFFYNVVIHYPNLDKIEELSILKNDIENIKNEKEEYDEGNKLDNYISLNQEDILGFVQKYTSKGVELTSINFADINLDENRMNIQIELQGDKKFVSKSILSMQNAINSIHVTDLDTQEYEDKTIARVGFVIHNK